MSFGSFSVMAAFGDALWLVAGAALGMGAMAMRHKLQAWREQRLGGEWDPY